MNAPSPIVVRCLRRAVVVGGDRAGADVDALADLGVAEVAHVVLLGAGAEARVLELGVVADLGATTDDAARPQVAERPDASPRPRSTDDSTIARPDPRTLGRSCESTIWLPAPMTLPSPTDVAPRRMTFGSRVTSGASVTPQSR